MLRCGEEDIKGGIKFFHRKGKDSDVITMTADVKKALTMYWSHRHGRDGVEGGILNVGNDHGADVMKVKVKIEFNASRVPMQSFPSSFRHCQR